MAQMDFLVCAVVALITIIGALLLTRRGISRFQRLFVGKAQIERLRCLPDRLKSLPVFGWRQRIRAEQMDREIFDAISFVRNIAAAGKGARVTADYLLEQLAQTEGALNVHYGRALSMLRSGRGSEIVGYFAGAVGTSMARDFMRLIIRWDQVSPDKLASTLLSYQSAMKEIRTTALKRKNELFSDLVFLPVIACVLLVLVNFIVVAYFIEQRDLMNQLFF